MTGIESKISIQQFAKDLNLSIIFEPENKEITLSTLSVSRPGLQLTGFFDYFASNRVQVFGNAETFYLNNLDRETRNRRFEDLIKCNIPCLIFSRGIIPQDSMIEICKKYNCPLLSSEHDTSKLVNELVIYLNRQLAPTISEHAGLLDVYGVGMMLIGKSGIGKSETALELVKRGHRLVSDDSVIIKRINDELYGSAPELIRYFMEVRGIGIIDIKNMYGAGAVMFEKEINCIIELEKWEEGKEYDRLGNNSLYTKILDIDIPRIKIPVKPGRNLAAIVEVAAMNYRLKKSGYDATEELIRRSTIEK